MKPPARATAGTVRLRGGHRLELPLPVLPDSGLGRADLLLGLWAAEQQGQGGAKASARALAGLAHAAGYCMMARADEDGAQETEGDTPTPATPTPATPTPPEEDWEGAVGLSPPATTAPPSPSPEKLRARFWGVTQRLALDASNGGQPERDSLPVERWELLGTPDQSGPPWQPIVPLARLMPALKRSLRSTRGGGLDLARLVQSLTHAKPLRRLPRRVQRGWAERVLLVLDMSETLLPYRSDLVQLAQHLWRWVGPAKLAVRVLADERHPLGPWRAWRPEGEGTGMQVGIRTPRSGWQAASSDTKVLLASDMGLAADDGGHSALAWRNWLRVVGAQGAQVQLWCPLPVGLPASAEGEHSTSLPRLQTVHWSAASPLRPRPLPVTDTHRTPQRLALAWQLRTWLAPAARAEPNLLRALRRELTRQDCQAGREALDAGLEHLVWQHPDMTRHHSARAVRAASLVQCRADFAALDSGQQCAVLDVLLCQHGAHPLLAHVETLAWAAHAKAEALASRKAVVDAAQDLLLRFARKPWQVADLPPAEVRDFTARLLRDADRSTLELCSPALSWMLVALHRARHGTAPLAEIPPGLAVADVARALGVSGQPQPYWLALDERQGWLVLSHTQPTPSRLLHPQPLLVDCAAVRVGEGVARWVQGGAGEDIALACLPWGVRQRCAAGEDGYPPLVDGDGTVCVDTGAERVTLAELARPFWSLAWGRNRDGVFALAPNPWGEPVPVGYPLPEGESVRVFEALGPKAKKIKGRARLTLNVDALGLAAGLVLDGEVMQVFRYIAAGRFLMGAPPGEDVHNRDEGPQHWVTIRQGFWLADTACSQVLWQRLKGRNPAHFNKNNRGGPQHPVENVSWDMAQDFLQRLQALLTGCHASLPTEAEWEYACRVGTGTPYSFGAVATKAQVNCAGQGGQTVAVKELPANRWGLHQMHGNVLEWCADRWREYRAEEVFDPGLDDTLAPSLSAKAPRVLRGGSWNHDAGYARSACRLRYTPDGQVGSAGFRVALRSKPSK